MGLAAQKFDPLQLAEDIRLVIWDLDETFWDGTLSEGGITYRPDHHDIVVELARRGIMSSLCSKNAFGAVQTKLAAHLLWDYFVFPSIDWTPKGGRIAAMLEQIGLRASSVLFIDDNPMNLAQAAHMNAGLNTATPEMIPELLVCPQLLGKDDPQLTRLAQYKVKERKAEAVGKNDGDTINFLRRSNVQVYLEYDVEAHLDRAIELINRTNQLNFTKKRLPEDMEIARTELRAMLAHNTTDAALIRVRDDFGDYGFAGFYLTRRINNKRRMEHFCFSCRTLNMYIEHWTYGFLGRPELHVAGQVLSNLHDPAVKVDWITPAHVDQMGAAPSDRPVQYDRIVARGGCDLASLVHYLSLNTGKIVEEFNQPKNGQMFRRDHSAFLLPSLAGGLDKSQYAAAAALGYEPCDFETELFEASPERTLYLLSFWADADIPLYRHRQSGLEVPYWLVGAQNQDLIARADLRDTVAKTDAQRSRVATLCAEYEHVGLLDQPALEARYTKLLDALPRDADVVLMLANERGPAHFANPDMPAHPHHIRLNAALRKVAGARENALLLDPAQNISGAQDLIDLNHFKRDVYHRIYRDLLDQLGTRDRQKESR